MNKKTVANNPKFCGTVNPILLTFPTLYMVEFEFSYVHYLLSKLRSTLNIERDDMQLKITYL